MPDPLVQRLEQLVGSAHVLVGADAAPYTSDWTGRWHGSCACVVRPGSAAEVAAVVEACAEADRVIVPQGGNTGLVGGAVPQGDAVLVSTRRLDRVDEVDTDDGRVRVGAGATLAAVQDVARDAGWDVGVDLASRGSATIGGMVATDAGGARVVAHGSMGAQVAGLQVVLPDGRTVSSWHGDEVAGRDLPGALVGSEGTLGVITAVVLRLVRPAPTIATVLLQTTHEHLGRVVEEVRAAVGDSPARLTACELLTREGTELAAATLGVACPVTAPVALLLDLAGDVPDALLAALDGCTEEPTVVGLDEPGRDRLWRLREGHTEAVATLGTPVKLDVRVPVGALGAFLTAVPAAVAGVSPGARCVLFGHAVEGNVHVNVVGALEVADRVEDVVYALVAEHDGSVVAEHGVGRAKRDHLSLTATDEELATMRRLKAALDPDDRCNPGVRVPAEAR